MSSIPADPHSEGMAPHSEEGHPPPKRHKGGHGGGHEPPSEVSINSLLDVLSVILMFLMKSFSATTVQIKPSADLQVPYSFSSLEVMQSTAITVTLKDILVDDKPVITFENGKVAEQDLSNAGLMIDPLFNKLQEVVAHLKKVESRNSADNAKFKGIVTIIGDRNIPAPLISQIMYTAGQAEYSQFKFAAIKASR